MSRRRTLAVAAIGIFLLTVAVACGSSDDTASSPTPLQYSFGLSAQVLAEGSDATAVRAIEFAPDGRIFYAEQFTGAIKIINPDGTLQATPFATLQVANWLDLDWGLTGLALDPQFSTNHFVYAFYTAPVSEKVGKPTIVRYTDTNGKGTDQKIITSDFPETFAGHEGYNANGEIHFGPDGFLYASIGDYDQGTADPAKGGHPELVNDVASPIGKLLRLNKDDGTGAPGNPFERTAGADARVFASGFREPFSFAFDSAGTLYGADNTTVSCEELNVIQAGKSYGWGTMGDFPFANCAAGTGTQPIYNYAREGKQPGDFLAFVETQGMAVLKGSKYSQLTDGIIVCESQKSLVDNVPSNGALVRITMTNATTASGNDIIVRDCKGAAAVHNGEVYYANGTQLLKLVTATATQAASQGVIPSGG